MQRLKMHTPREKAKTVLLQYAGGKARIAKWVLQYFPHHKIYVEPFGGVASVLLRKPRSQMEVYNDVEDEVVNLMEVMRDRESFDHLVDQLRKTPYSRAEYLQAYVPATDTIERARRLIVRIQMAWGGRAPTGRVETFDPTNSMSWMPYIDGLALIHRRLQGVTIENRDALECMRWHDSRKTLHYVDPPYLAANQSRYKHDMTKEQHKALLECLKGLDGMVVVSSYPNKLYERALADWTYITRQNTTANNTYVVEALWINAAAHKSGDFWNKEGVDEKA